MAALTFRVGGSRLTNQQGDDNIHNLDDRITVLETGLPEAARGIVSTERSGSNLIITYTDDTTDTIDFEAIEPEARGAWQPFTVYNVNDFVTANGSVYVVLFAHTSGATFDPGANDGDGHNYYGLWLDMPVSALPAGGAIGYSIRKRTTADYDYELYQPTLADLFDVGLFTEVDEGDQLVFSGGKWRNEAFSLPAPTGGTDGTLGGVFANPGEDEEWVFGIDEDGNILTSTIGFSDLTGTATAGQLPAISALNGTVADSQLLQIKKQTVASSGGILTINRSLGEHVSVSITENITSIVVNNWPTASIFGKVVIYWVNTGSFTVAGFDDAGTHVYVTGGVAPTITSGSGKRDKTMLSTWDNGAHVDLDVAGQDYQEL